MAFLADVGPRPSADHSIDRIDNNGHYEPGNVKWSTPTEQCSNRRSSRTLTIDGTTRTVAQWARIVGLRDSTILARLKTGSAPRDAVFRPSLRPK